MIRKAFAIQLFSVVALIVLAAAMVMPALPALAAPQKLVYQVQHPTYGKIGTLTNAIEKNGDQTTVTSDGSIRVSILGIVLYRQEFSRIEHWIGDRLMAFHGVTTVNGRATEVNGSAEGDHFVVSSPGGNATAPATVRIANPWSADALKGDTMLVPDRGTVDKVVVNRAEMTSVAINGKMVRAQRYEIDRPTGEKRYEVWLDEQGTPVMFNVTNRGAPVTFTLMS